MPSRDTTPLDTRPTVFTHWATAELWRGVLDQEALWIPEPAWNTYMLCSVFDLTPDEAAALDKGEVLLTQAPAHVRATVDVPGVVRVADMDADYRRCVVTFLEHNAAAICLGLSGPPSTNHPTCLTTSRAISTPRRHCGRHARPTLRPAPPGSTPSL